MRDPDEPRKPPVYKIISGFMGHEVHGRHSYEDDDQAQFNHMATYDDRKSAQEDIKRRKEYDRRPKKHDMTIHGEGKPYNSDKA